MILQTHPFKLRDHGIQLVGLREQRLGRRGSLVHHCCMLLSGDIHLTNGGANLLNAAALLIAGVGDFDHQRGDALNALHYRIDGFPRLINQLAAAGDLVDGIFDKPFNLFCRTGATLRTSPATTAKPRS